MLKLINEKLVIELELLSIRVLLGKVTLKVGQEKYLSLVLSRTYKTKDLNGEETVLLQKKNCC